MIEWSVSTDTSPFDDDTKKPKIDLPRFGWCLENWEGLKSITVQLNPVSLHDQQLHECPSFWLDGHPPPSGNHTILLLERTPIFPCIWREFSPSLIALNPLSSAFHRRIKSSAEVKVVEKMSRFSTDGKSKWKLFLFTFVSSLKTEEVCAFGTR